LWFFFLMVENILFVLGVLSATAVLAEEKAFIDLACSSHNAMWEKNHNLLFKASLEEWLSLGSVNGTQEGMLRLGY